jgi:hypothetical protein
MEMMTMYEAMAHLSDEAQQVLIELERAHIMEADALLLLPNGLALPVKGLRSILRKPNRYVAVPLPKDTLPKTLYPDVVYLQTFADTDDIFAPYGSDTVYRVQPRKERGRTGAYKLPAPKTR